MDIKKLFDPQEKPLDNLVEDGGFSVIFRNIVCVGDSLSSGEFEVHYPDETKKFFDIYDMSWGQFISRATGAKVYNFSKGGMSAKAYMESFADERGYWDVDPMTSAYTIALGVNDLICAKQEIGTVDDIKANYKDNADTFAGWFGAVLQKYQELSPKAKFFLITMPKTDNWEDEIKGQHAALCHQIAERFDNVYVIDLYEYGPVYDAEFKKNFYLTGHLSPTGYALTAKLVMSYLDYIVRHNMPDFEEIGLIGL